MLAQGPKRGEKSWWGLTAPYVASSACLCRQLHECICAAATNGVNACVWLPALARVHACGYHLSEVGHAGTGTFSAFVILCETA